jgi:hypothetical protein
VGSGKFFFSKNKKASMVYFKEKTVDILNLTGLVCSFVDIKTILI